MIIRTVEIVPSKSNLIFSTQSTFSTEKHNSTHQTGQCDCLNEENSL